MREEKERLRRQMLEIRRGLPPEEADAQARAVLAHVLAFPPFQEAERVMLYASMPGELSTDGLLGAVLDLGKVLLLPRCEGGGRATVGRMTARRVTSLSALVPGPWGIREPDAGVPVGALRAGDLVLCPGLAFDPQGNRLGFGAGYYDAFLARCPAARAGLCFTQQLAPSVPRQPHDIPMDWIATARGIFPRDP